MAACCGLCSATKGCAAWVISTGQGPTNRDNQVPSCWCKKDTKPVTSNVARAHGVVATGFGPDQCVSKWGAAFLAGVLIGPIVYFGCGVLYGTRSGTRGRHALASHPHHGRWVQLRGMVSDGVAFSRDRLGMNGDSNSRQRPLLQPNNEDKGGSRGAKKSKKAQLNATKSSGSKGKSRDKDRKSTQHPAAPPRVIAMDVAHTALLTTPANSTAAGNGRRWVRVSN